MDETEVSAYDLVDVVGIHLVTAQTWLRALKQENTIHIVGWDVDSLGRDKTPLFRLGAGKDKPRRRKTVAERQKTYRLKKKRLLLQQSIEARA